MKTGVKDNPKLLQRPLKSGKIALYLEYYLGRQSIPKVDDNGKQLYYQSGKMEGKPIFEVKHIRKKEELKLYLFSKPRTPEERTHNTNTLTQAKQIRNTREQEFLSGTMGYKIVSKNDNLIPHFDSYLSTYTKTDVRNIKLAINRFKSYLRENYPLCAIRKTDVEVSEINKQWEESHKDIFGKHQVNENEYYRFTLYARQFNEAMIKGFVDYLQNNSEGSGAVTVYRRFKKIVKALYKDGALQTNPTENIACKSGDCFTKDILSKDEIKNLLNTHYFGENPNIRKAFIFTLFTGVRYCDVKELKYNNVDYQNRTLKFEQAKTKGHSIKSIVEMPLREDVITNIIGTPEEFGKTKEDLIFDLPSHTMCLKALRHWSKKAGIDKHITWHCGRHSFATNLLESGANIKVVAELLGHSDLKYVTRYVRAIDESKKRALDTLPKLY